MSTPVVKTKDLLKALERAGDELTALRAEMDWALAKLDALRTLLREALPWIGHMSDDPQYGLRARIAKELGDAP